MLLQAVIQLGSASHSGWGSGLLNVCPFWGPCWRVSSWPEDILLMPRPEVQKGT